MKKTIIGTLVIGMMALFNVQAQNGMDQFMVQVDGLGCPFCAYGLEKKFKEFKGIKDVKIDIETGDFSFSYPAEKALTLADVQKQVEKAGYTPITSKIVRANGKVEKAEAAVAQSVLVNGKKAKVKVAGNCEMCEARIVKAAKGVSGVSNVSWDKNSKLMSVEFDPKATSMTEIEKAVSTAGHDTHNSKALDATYKSLPACCLYERVEY